MKLVKLLILTGLLSSNVHAGELLAPFQFGFGAAVSSINDDIRENESLGYELSLGYQFNENFLLETAYADYQFTSMNVTPWITRLKGMLPVSDYASLYLGGGVAVDKEVSSPLLSGGIKYQMSKNWVLDAGYQSIFKIEARDSTITSLLISVIYKPSLESYTPSIYRQEEKVFKEEPKAEKPKLIKEDKVAVVDKPEVVEVEPIQKEEVCTVKSKEYKLNEGDYLYKIARENNMSFRELLTLNAEFVNRANQDLVYPGEVVNLNYNICN